MRNFIRLLIVLVVLLMTVESFAQKMSIKGGLNLSNILMKDDDDTFSDDFKAKPGFHVGATVEFPITEMFSFETGLLLSTKGFKSSDAYESMSLNLLYLDVPANGKITFDVGGTKVFGLFGPYFGIGLSGKSKYEYDGETGDETIKWGTDREDDFKRLDFGLTAGAGVEINSIQIALTYGLGLANISPVTSNGNKVNNRVFGVSLGYIFAGK